MSERIIGREKKIVWRFNSSSGDVIYFERDFDDKMIYIYDSNGKDCMCCFTEEDMPNLLIVLSIISSKTPISIQPENGGNACPKTN